MTQPVTTPRLQRWLPATWWVTAALVLLSGIAPYVRHVLDGEPDVLGYASLNSWALTRAAAETALCALTALVARRGHLPVCSVAVAAVLAVTAADDARAWLFGELTFRGFSSPGG